MLMSQGLTPLFQIIFRHSGLSVAQSVEERGKWKREATVRPVTNSDYFRERFLSVGLSGIQQMATIVCYIRSLNCWRQTGKEVVQWLLISYWLAIQSKA
jgi:hypothetical protein